MFKNLYMPYIIIALLLALPLLLFLRKYSAFSAFTYPKLIAALNRSALIYLIMNVGFAFLFAWLDTAYVIKEDGSWLNIAAEVSIGYITISLAGILPLLIVLNIINWFVKRKAKKTIAEEQE